MSEMGLELDSKLKKLRSSIFLLSKLPKFTLCRMERPVPDSTKKLVCCQSSDSFWNFGIFAFWFIINTKNASPSNIKARVAAMLKAPIF